MDFSPLGFGCYSSNGLKTKKPPTGSHRSAGGHSQIIPSWNIGSLEKIYIYLIRIII
jgi:hypothetical protein